MIRGSFMLCLTCLFVAACATNVALKDVADEIEGVVGADIASNVEYEVMADEIVDNCQWKKGKVYTTSQGSLKLVKTQTDRDCFRLCRAISDILPGQYNGASRYNENYSSEKWRGVCYCIKGMDGEKERGDVDICFLSTGPATPPKAISEKAGPATPPKSTCEPCAPCEKAGPATPPKAVIEKGAAEEYVLCSELPKLREICKKFRGLTRTSGYFYVRNECNNPWIRFCSLKKKGIL